MADLKVPSSSSWVLRVLVLVGGWFSVAMTAASFYQYFVQYKDDTDPLNETLRNLQLPALFLHPLFAIPALLLAHWFKPGFGRITAQKSGTRQEKTSQAEDEDHDHHTRRLLHDHIPAAFRDDATSKNPLTVRVADWILFAWTFFAAISLIAMYVRYLDPSAGTPSCLIDRRKESMRTQGLVADIFRVAVYFSATVSVAFWAWRAKKGEV